MRMKSLWLDGKPSRDFGVAITGAGTYDAPERDLEMISVEGRSGDLVIDRGRYKNITIEYPASICRDFGLVERSLKEWLYGSHGYRRLEDDYSPDTYRMGIFKGPLNFSPGPLNRHAEFTLSFDCKPQRWLKQGELPIALEDINSEGGQFVRNPTPFPAQPLIQVYGDGPGTIRWKGADSIWIDLEILEFPANAACIVLDCESMAAYFGSDNLDSNIHAPVFPVIPGGGTTFAATGGITSVTITPRWWTL